MPGDPELSAEQAHLDHAYACLAAMRERAEQLVGQSEDPDLEPALKRRVRLLGDSLRPLCFGRIDEEGGARWYIGRRHVEDAGADPVVVEWRAPVAVPFYRASVAEPMGLVRRRQLMVEGREVRTIADDLFGPGARDADGDGPRVRGREALLAELERSRTGEMYDIVATIQAEQDEVIRAPLDGVLAVQGGPGTGKTAIGLHRAAYLLYTHESLSRSGVLVVGPNRTFLRYIAQVLPSLGEEAVVQTTLRDLLPATRVRAEDSPVAGRVKGDGRMADVLARALDGCRRAQEADVEVRYGLSRLVLPAERANEAAAGLAARRAPYEAGRAALRDRLLRVLHDAYRRRVGALDALDYGTMARSVRTDPAFKAALDRLWPSVSAAALVRDLLASRERLARAADGLLGPDEQNAIVRPAAARIGQERWTEADVALVDEVNALLSGTVRNYGHVVVDEAQDLSPMQVRMLARRVPSGSVTVLGDLAQGTGVWAHDHWDEVVDLLPRPKGAAFRELRLGYRAPGQVLELASRLLTTAAPQVRPTESVRPGRTAPVLVRVLPAERAGAAAAEARRLAGLFGSVAVIVPTELVEEAAAGLAEGGVEWGEAERDGLGRPVTLLPAPGVKGLEFDAVVVVEPARIALDAPRGLRLLYVALTRPTQHLSVVHSEDLPAPLALRPGTKGSRSSCSPRP